VAVATDYDEVGTDLKDSHERSLDALQSARASNARSVVNDLDETGTLDVTVTPVESSSPRN
jgi:hypothetical protein